MQPGQFLVRGDEKRLIVEVLTNIIAIQTDIADIITWIEKDRLANYGWSLLEEPWVPKMGEMYFFLGDDGTGSQTANLHSYSDLFRFSTGNYFQKTEEIELYKQKLIERMGRKEN